MNRALRTLRALDDTWVPRAALRLRAGLDSVHDHRVHTRQRVVAAWRALTAPADPARPGVLRRLDERYASRGPLALLREIPQLGLLIVASLFLAGAGVALARSGPGTEGTRAGQEAGPHPDTLGPPEGTPITPYLDGARQRAADLSRDDPDRDHLALVLLSRYLTPKETVVVLSEVEIRRVYLRAQIPGEVSEVLSADTSGDVESQLEDLYEQTAKRKDSDRTEFLGLARSIDPQTKEEKQFKTFYEQAARTAGKEATAYRSGCACVFGVVVEGPARVLAELPSLSGIRGVDIAESDRSLVDLTVLPLLPENTGTVKPLPKHGGGGVDG